MTDVWAEADAASQGNAGQQQGESRQAAYGNKQSRLFGNEGGAPSLFNKHHPVGTERSGIIKKAPYDQQRTNMKGELLFWVAGQKSPQAVAVDPNTGQKNRPVMDTVVEIKTEYTMDAAEAAALNRETPYEGTDRRVFVGKELKAFKEGIAAAVENGVPLTCDEDMVGKRLIQKRIGQKPNPNGGDSIKIHTFTIENA
jgi:hypothetical protein